MSNKRLLPRAAVCGIVIAACGASAAAADWKPVLNGRTETVEIDMARIAQVKNFVGMGSGITAWSRVRLGREVPDMAGVYDAIAAQNLYDCEGGHFTTLKRAYYKGETLVREEAVTRQRANSVQAGSIDERLLNEACKPRTVGDAQRVAMQAAQAMQGVGADGGERPSAMHADMRTMADGESARVMKVADTPAERPKMIQLPAIDKEKAAAEAAAAGMTYKPATTTPAPAVAPAPPASTHAAAPTTSYRSVEPRRVAPAVERAAAENRQTREFILATSGPRRVSKKSSKKDDAKENPAYDMHVHWGYDGAGAPDRWSKLRPEYATCEKGKRQSPIDIRESIKVDLETIKFDYKPTRFRIVDNGHTVQVNVGEGSTLNVMGKRYELVQFHFHRPSEERVNGRPYDMVVHLVHKDYDNNLAVVAVLLERGAEHPQIQTVWNNMPLEQNMELGSADVLEPIKLLPLDRSYWTYMGSLTTPPCTENVLWMVLKQPVQVSPEQIGIFARLYKNNARPVQPSNGRLVKESR